MPTVKQYTAGGEPANIQVTERRFPVPDFAGEQFLGESITDIGKNLGLIAGGMAREQTLAERQHQLRLQKTFEKMQKQQDELDTVNLSSQYDSGLILIEDNLKNEPDIAKRPALYIQQANELHQKLMKDAPNLDVAQAFQKHSLGKFPIQAAKFLGDTRKQIAQQQVVELHTTVDNLINEAATMDLQEREEYKATILGLIQRSIHFPDEKTKGEYARTAVEHFEERQMKMMAESHYLDQMLLMDKEGYFNNVPVDKRAGYIETAHQKQHQDQVRIEQAMTEAKHKALDAAWGLANQGQLGQTQIDMIARGENSLITPEHAKALKERNANPIIGDSGPIKMLVQEYMLGERTVERVRVYRQKLNELNRQMGGQYNEDIKKFGDVLQTDETVARNANTAEIAAGIRKYNEDIKAITPTTGFPRLDKLDAPKRKIEEGEDKGKIYRGADPDKVLKDRQEKRKQEKDAITGPRKTIQDLLKAR